MRLDSGELEDYTRMIGRRAGHGLCSEVLQEEFLSYCACSLFSNPEKATMTAECGVSGALAMN
jgi:hypothetical protein